MTEKELRDISNKEYKKKLEDLKNCVFSQVVSRLDCFNQDFFFEDDYLYSENYFSPTDLVVELSPCDYDFLVSFRNAKI